MDQGRCAAYPIMTHTVCHAWIIQPRFTSTVFSSLYPPSFLLSYSSSPTFVSPLLSKRDDHTKTLIVAHCPPIREQRKHRPRTSPLPSSFSFLPSTHQICYSPNHGLAVVTLSGHENIDVTEKGRNEWINEWMNEESCSFSQWLFSEGKLMVLSY